MKYVLRTILSLIWCPLLSLIITVITLLKGIWGNGFYLWMDELGCMHLSLPERAWSHVELWESRRFYIGEIFRWVFVKHWWNWNEWHDAERK